MEPQQGTVLIGVVLVAVDLAIRIAALIVIPRERKPTAAMAWLLAILLVPYLGILFFLLIGSTKLPKKRRAKQAEVNRMITAGAPDVHAVPAAGMAQWPEWFGGVVNLNRALGAVPAVGGSRAELISDYAGSLAGMTADIDSATRFVHVEFYIVSFDVATKDFFRAMEEAVTRGVVVRLLLDHIASIRAPGHRETLAELDRIGVQWSFMLPVRPLKGQWQRPDLRNHRKLVVVDGRIGFTGSLNLIDPSYLLRRNLRRGLQWRDTWLEIVGPPVRALDVLFWSDWWAETNELVELATTQSETDGDLLASAVPSGPGFEGEINLRVFVELVHAAEERITIVSPYFVPDEAMRYAITSAAIRGVEVELFASEIGDQFWTHHAQRSYYEELLRAGVRITLFAKPTVLHSKFMTFDDKVSIVGSSNIDMRSFGLNFEVSMLIEGESMVKQLQGTAEGYRLQSSELTLETWLARPRVTQLFDNVARLTSALQ